MKSQTYNSIKNTSIFKMYDIQHNYHRHKQKINQIKSSNIKQKVKKQYSSAVNAANQLKKNWLLTQANRQIMKDKQIYDQNQLLYKQILNAGNRQSQRHKILSESNILNRSRTRTSHSVNQQKTIKVIKKQNQQLMERILSIKSPLSKDKMNESYMKIKQTKKRMQTYSSLNKSRIKSTLTKFKIKPQIYFPTLGTELKHGQKSGVKQLRRSGSFSRQEQLQNEFFSLNTQSQKTEDEKPQWKNSLSLPRKKKFSQKQQSNRTRVEPHSKYHKPKLNRTNF